MDQDQLASYASFARTLAQSARNVTLPLFGTAIEATNKAETGFDPVTKADLSAERTLRALIEYRYSSHGITGEELPDRPATSGLSWSLDPIDGTRAFLCGLPSWTTLIALLERGAPVLGVIDAPRLDELYLGYGDVALLVTSAGDRQLATSGCASVPEARLSSTDPDRFAGAEAHAFARLRKAARVTRYGLDGYAYARLAAGAIDIVVESGLHPHDLNALVPVVKAAGGAIGNWRGGDDLSEGQLLAAATPALFDAAARLLS